MKAFFTKYTLVSLVVGLTIGFLAGMEYKAYQIRSAFEGAVNEISGMFGESSSDTDEEELDVRSDEDEPIRTAQRDAQADSAMRLRGLVDMEVVSKGFTPADYLNGPYDSTIDFGFKFSNTSDKDVRGVQGEVVFYDIFENEIYRSNLSYDQGIEAQSSFTWNAGIDYNEFFDEHQKLRSMELENLQYEWLPNTIIFADGTKEQ